MMNFVNIGPMGNGLASIVILWAMILNHLGHMGDELDPSRTYGRRTRSILAPWAATLIPMSDELDPCWSYRGQA